MIRHELGPEGFEEPVLDFDPHERTCYVAGPEGFDERCRPWMNDVLIPMLEREGFFPINPWELTTAEEMNTVKALPLGEERRIAHQQMNLRIPRRNHEAMRRAHFLVASLDGQEVDSGTASEIGAFAMMHDPIRPIFARRSDFRMSGEEGAIVNLQVAYWIHLSGGAIVSSLEELRQAVHTYLLECRRNSLGDTYAERELGPLGFETVEGESDLKITMRKGGLQYTFYCNCPRHPFIKALDCPLHHEGEGGSLPVDMAKKAAHEKPWPEHLVRAVLHRIGKRAIIRDDNRLVQLFAKGAEDYPEIMSDFIPHPQYGDCPRLSAIVRHEILGGGLRRVGHSDKLEMTPHLLGPNGHLCYDALLPQHQKAVDALADYGIQLFS